MIQETDVVIVGGGPAGLAAALNLGRGCKRVLLCDAGPRRNAAAVRMHGFPSQDGVPPTEFRRIAREQLAPYDVELRDVGIHDIRPTDDGFVVSLIGGEAVTCRRVLLATGMIDEIPDVPGIREPWGHSVFQCPYCHGWEFRGRPWGILASTPALLEFAIFLTGWSPQVTAFTNGPLELDDELRQRLEAAGVRVEPRRIARLLSGSGGRLRAVEHGDGAIVPCEAMVVRPPQRQPTLVSRLGLAVDDGGYVRVDGREETSVPGVYAAGDLTSPAQAATVASAAGVRAAWSINHDLNVGRL